MRRHQNTTGAPTYAPLCRIEHPSPPAEARAQDAGRLVGGPGRMLAGCQPSASRSPQPSTHSWAMARSFLTCRAKCIWRLTYTLPMTNQRSQEEQLLGKVAGLAAFDLSPAVGHPSGSFCAAWHHVKGAVHTSPQEAHEPECETRFPCQLDFNTPPATVYIGPYRSNRGSSGWMRPGTPLGVDAVPGPTRY